MIISYIVFISCILLRAAIYISGKKITSTDEYFHYYYINLLKINKHSLPSISPHILGTNPACTYPYFYHLLLSYLPISYINFIAKWGGLLFDLGSALIVTLLATTILKSHTASIEFYLFSLSLYIIAPALTFFSIGPRAYNLTPRIFSQFINTLMLGFLIIGIEVHSNLYLIIALFLMAIALLSSKFIVQVYYLGVIILCLLQRSLIPLEFVLVSSLLACLISKGRYLSQLKAQYNHSKGYLRYENCYKNRGDWGKLLSFIRKLEIRATWYECIYYNPILSGILKNLDFIVLIIYHQINPTSYLNNLLFTAIILFTITSFGVARILGEAERYLEYAFPLKWLLVIGFVYDKPYLKYSILIYYILFFLYSLYFSRNSLGTDNIITEIKSKLPSEGCVLCLNNSQSFIFQKDNLKIICDTFCNTQSNEESQKLTKWLLIAYPYIHPLNLQEICKTYHVDYIIYDKAAATIVKNSYNLTYNLETLIPVFENKNYILLKLEQD